jgi:hypothetical protein
MPITLNTTQQVTSEFSLGDCSSTKKYSIGSVPFKNRIDRLTHDKGPDFFRSTLTVNSESQRQLKKERLSNVAKVFDLIAVAYCTTKKAFVFTFSAGCK